MENTYRLILGFVLFLGTGEVLASCSSLSKINWMLGQWQSSDSKTLQTEVWQKLDEQTYVGTGTVINKGSEKKPFIESLRLLEMSNEVFYLAKTPQNSMPVAFKLVECNKKSAKFVNTKHDFPNSLHYHQAGANQLLVEVRSSQGKGFDIRFAAMGKSGASLVRKVKQYIAAYNAADIEGMQILMADNIRWMSVSDDNVAVETENKQQLTQAMSQYFQSAGTQSEMLQSHTVGNFVSGIEKASWQSGDKLRSQCSPVIYEFDAGKIKNVWYFNSTQCE